MYSVHWGLADASSHLRSSHVPGRAANG
jgi:hypothetical protein